MKLKKKKSSPKMEHLFSLNSSGHLRSDAHQSQIIGGDADVDHTQTMGGLQSNFWGDISLWVLAPLGEMTFFLRSTENSNKSRPDWHDDLFIYLVVINREAGQR